MRVKLPRRPLGPGKFLLIVAFCVVFVYCDRVLAEIPAPAAPHTTLVIFADHRMADDEWNALFAALHSGLTGSADGRPLASDAELIRGDAIAHVPQLKDAIAVYLQGDCALVPPPLDSGHVIEGALGWVKRVNGRIEPYVHVDCRLLVQMLGRMGMHLNRDRRNAVMGEAMARVIVHEWIHITTQSAAHADRGVSQAQFTMYDLLADDRQSQPRKRHRNQTEAPQL
ncbi:MAG: hypothetical protein WA802_01895 [Terracidiphilus sp.]